MKYYEEDYVSPTVKKLVSILNVTLVDRDVANFIYKLNRINISESKITTMRQATSKEALAWSEELEKMNLANSVYALSTKKPKERMAIGIDEGKVHIRNAKRNMSTKRYERYWKNVKFGVCYEFDENGKKSGESKYTAEIDIKLNEFGRLMRELLIKNDYLFSKHKITLSDGAIGYNEFLQNLVGNAVHILDAMHLKEHLWILGKSLFPDLPNGQHSELAEAFVDKSYHLLKTSGFEVFIKYIKKNKPKRKNAKLWKREINYFDKNKNRLDYPYYIKLHYPLGSGVVEGGIKYVCNKRLKNGSACWRVEHVNGLLKLRIIWFNGYFDDFWSWRKKYYSTKYKWYA